MNDIGVMQMLGYIMLLAIFVGLFGVIWYKDSLRVSVIVLGTTAGMCAWVFGAAYLITS